MRQRRCGGGGGDRREERKARLGSGGASSSHARGWDGRTRLEDDDGDDDDDRGEGRIAGLAGWLALGAMQCSCSAAEGGWDGGWVEKKKAAARARFFRSRFRQAHVQRALYCIVVVHTRVTRKISAIHPSSRLTNRRRRRQRRGFAAAGRDGPIGRRGARRGVARPHAGKARSVAAAAAAAVGVGVGGPRACDAAVSISVFWLFCEPVAAGAGCAGSAALRALRCVAWRGACCGRAGCARTDQTSPTAGRAPGRTSRTIGRTTAAGGPVAARPESVTPAHDTQARACQTRRHGHGRRPRAGRLASRRTQRPASAPHAPVRHAPGARPASAPRVSSPPPGAGLVRGPRRALSAAVAPPPRSYCGRRAVQMCLSAA